MKQTKTPLLVWWPMGKSNPFFDRYQSSGLVHFLVNQMQGPIGLPDYYPGDGHPTPEGNRHIASLMAESMLRILDADNTATE